MKIFNKEKIKNTEPLNIKSTRGLRARVSVKSRSKIALLLGKSSNRRKIVLSKNGKTIIKINRKIKGLRRLNSNIGTSGTGPRDPLLLHKNR